MTHLSLDTPIGPLTLVETAGSISHLGWGHRPGGAETPVLAEARHQIEAYFEGSLDAFSLPLDPAGTPFQRRVWAALKAIPKGHTLGYGQLAARLGTAARAVGGACGANPIPILIPCHRVVAASGDLTGYSGFGGLDTKRRLLDLERAPRPEAA